MTPATVPSESRRPARTERGLPFKYCVTTCFDRFFYYNHCVLMRISIGSSAVSTHQKIGTLPNRFEVHLFTTFSEPSDFTEIQQF